MKFYVKNDFYFNGIKKYKGEIIEVSPGKINKLKEMNVLGAPVKEIKIETAVVKPIENEMINRSITKAVKKPIKKGKK